MSLYGVVLGSPFALPECADAQRHEAMCYEHVYGSISELLPTEPHTFIVHFPDGKRPSISKYGSFSVKTIGGIVAQISITTKGLEVQQEVIDQLTQKFGRVQRADKKTAQNSFGAKFNYVEAAWSIGSSTVLFSGMAKVVDEGTLFAMTAKYGAYLAAEDKRKRQSEPKL